MLRQVASSYMKSNRRNLAHHPTSRSKKQLQRHVTNSKENGSCNKTFWDNACSQSHRHIHQQQYVHSCVSQSITNKAEQATRIEFQQQRQQQSQKSNNHAITSSKSQKEIPLAKFPNNPILMSPQLYNVYSIHFQTQQQPVNCYIRYLSTKNTNNDGTTGNRGKKDSDSNDNKDDSKGPIINPADKTKKSSFLVGSSELRQTADEKLAAIVDSVRPALKRVSSESTISDLVAVYAIIALIIVIVSAPRVVRHMRRSDSTYDDLDGEDPVADLAKLVRDEYDQNPSENSTRRLALDTMLADLLKSEELQNAVTNLVVKVIESTEFKKSCQILLKELWTDLVQDPETLAQVIHLLYNAIQDEKIKDAAIKLVMEIFNDKEVLDELTRLLQRLGNEKDVQMATQSLLSESAHKALNDPEILDHSMEFATDVVGDDVLQRTAGEALRNTLSYAVRPGLSVFLSVLGAGLMVISVVALRASNSDQAAVDSAVNASLRSLESGSISDLLSKIVSFPFRILVLCKDTTVTIILMPFRLVNATVVGIGKAGNATINAIGAALSWLVQLPSRAIHSILTILGKVGTTIIGGVSYQTHQLINVLSKSILGDMARACVASVTAIVGAIQSGIIVMDNVIYSIIDAITFVSTSIVRIVMESVDMTTAGVMAVKDATEAFMGAIWKFLVATSNVTSSYTKHLDWLASQFAIFLSRLFQSSQVHKE